MWHVVAPMDRLVPFEWVVRLRWLAAGAQLVVFLVALIAFVIVRGMEMRRSNKEPAAS